jgi:hypothetical protein
MPTVLGASTEFANVCELVEDSLQSTERPEFSLKEVEAVLAHMLRIHPEKRATFAARLQQLQRLGLPSGARPGRGVRFRYAYWQLAEFSLFCDLLDAGVPPHLIQTHFKAPGFYGLAGQGEGVEHSTADRDNFTYIELHALDYLRSSNPDAVEHAADHVMKRGPGSYLASANAETPVIAINLSDRLRKLKAAVAAVMPQYAGEAIFPPTPSHPGKLA